MSIRRCGLDVVAVLLGIASESALAADRVWSGNGLNGNFNNGFNWSAASVPGPGDVAFFSNTAAARNVVFLNTSSGVGTMVVAGTSAVGAYEFRGGGAPLVVNGLLSLTPNTPASMTNNASISSSLTFLQPNSALSLTNAQLSTQTLVGEGHLLVQNGGSFTANASAEVRSGGTLSITGGGMASSAGYFDIGTGSAATLRVDGAGSAISGGGTFSSAWGFNNGAATVTLSNAAVATYSAGRQVASFGSLSTATVSVASGALLNVTGPLVITGANAGAATVSISGGSASINGASQVSNRGNVLLDTDSTLSFLGDATFNTGSSFRMKDGGTLVVGAGKSLNFNGGTAQFQTTTYSQPAGTIWRIANGSKVTFDRSMNVANGTGAITGVLAVDGGNSLFEVNGDADSIWAPNTGNTASIILSNGGTARYDANVRAAANGGTAVVSLLSGGRMEAGTLVAGGAAASAATINLDGGNLNCGTIDLRQGATLNYFSGSVQLDSSLLLSGNALAKLWPSGNTNVSFRSISISDAARLDVGNNAFIVNYAGASPLASIQSQIASGRNGGDWQGSGVTSSLAAMTPNRAIGFAEASALGSPPTFQGIAIDTTSIVARYTLYGDADLSGGVNLDDFTRLAAGFGSGGTWVQGDFNYDNVVNLDDFTALAANFGQALPAGASRAAAVPEPGVGLLVALLFSAANRIRRSRV